MIRHRATRRPMPRLGAAAVAAVLLGACQTVVVPAEDGTAPSLSVTLPDAERLGARYAPATPAGPFEPLNPNLDIDPSRPLFLRPADADTPIRFVFHAIDPESGISAGDARVVVSFACQTNEDPDHFPPLRRSGLVADYYATFGRPAAPGTTTDVSAGTTITVTLRGLWRHRHCPTTINHPGEIVGLWLLYYAKADNNGRPSPLGDFRLNNNRIEIRSVPVWEPATR